MIAVSWIDPETDQEYMVYFEISGRYIPATRLEPAEWPDAEWDGKVEDEDGNMIDDQGVKDRIEEDLESLEEKALEIWSER